MFHVSGTYKGESTLAMGIVCYEKKVIRHLLLSEGVAFFVHSVQFTVGML